LSEFFPNSFAGVFMTPKVSVKNLKLADQSLRYQSINNDIILNWDIAMISALDKQVLQH
jgi:hypothetical protein